MIKRILGIAPKATVDGAFSPSLLALKLATSPATDFDNSTYENRYTDGKLITGASPQAANDFGKLTAITLLNEVAKN